MGAISGAGTAYPSGAPMFLYIIILCLFISMHIKYTLYHFIAHDIL